MWNWLGGRGVGCWTAGEHLEKTSDAGEIPPWREWLEAAPAEVRAHLADCQACRRRAEEFFAARDLLRSTFVATQDPGQAFAAGVMRAIAARETAQRKVPDAWGVVPRMAARVAWVSAIVLVLATTWTYERKPALPATAATTDTFLDPAPQPATQDDVLLSLAVREP